MNQNEWSEKLEKLTKKYEFPDGYKLLYCPWQTIGIAKIAFISLNPGKPPINADLRVISDERGNSYEVELNIAETQLNKQFLRLCKFLKVMPNDVLTGVICPIRSKSWDGKGKGNDKHARFLDGSIFTKEMKNIGISLGEEFWSEALKNINTIITIGEPAKKSIVKIFRAKLIKEVNTGWQNTKLRKYVGHDEKYIIQFPHLSIFQLFSKERYLPAIESIFD